MIFDKDKKRIRAVLEYFKYVEDEVLPHERDSELIGWIKEKLQDGYHLIENQECGVAFENLSTVLVENYVILNRKGIKIVQKIINLCELDISWEYDLRRIDSLGYVHGSWKLVDSEELSKTNKYTFYKPSRKVTDQLKIGNLVKMTFEFESTNKEHPRAERMWVKITKINNIQFKGELNNHPFYLHELQAGDEIIFEHKHIIDHNLEISEPNLVDKYINRCFVTSKVLHENQQVNYLYREKPLKNTDERDYEDSGWKIMAGDETQEYMDDDENIHLVSLGAVLTIDDSFIHLLESPIGTSYERNEKGEFIKIET